MKLLSIAVLLTLVSVACKEAEKSESATMPGAYKMTSLVMRTGDKDSSYNDPNQFKIYTEDYMMYATVNPPDSVSSFGIGTYSIEKDTVTENIIYSAGDSTTDDTARTYKLHIEKQDKGYKQYIAGMTNSAGEKFSLTETYTRQDSAKTSPLDGAWRLAKYYTVKGTDSTLNDFTVFKVYYAGHVIWGHNFKDSLKKVHTGVGWGKFTVDGNKLTESMVGSTYAVVRGNVYNIEIEILGKDSFKQIEPMADGSKGIEIYERLKK